MLAQWNKSLYFAGLLSLMLSLAVFKARPLCAQVAGATVSSVITDDSPTPLANAKVSIKNVVTGVVRTSKTGKDGQYNAPNLLPGTYEITATAAG